MDFQILCKCAPSDLDWKPKDYIPLISSAIVILLFIIDRIIAARIRKKELERNFYYKVILEPNITKISLFFNEIQELYQNSSIKLQNENNKISDYLKLLMLEIELFKEKKRDFEFQLIIPIQKRYPTGGSFLSSDLQNLQDYYITQLDLMKFDQESIVTFNRELHSLKANFLSNLYKPLD